MWLIIAVTPLTLAGLVLGLTTAKVSGGTPITHGVRSGWDSSIAFAPSFGPT